MHSKRSFEEETTKCACLKDRKRKQQIVKWHLKAKREHQLIHNRGQTEEFEAVSQRGKTTKLNITPVIFLQSVFYY